MSVLLPGNDATQTGCENQATQAASVSLTQSDGTTCSLDAGATYTVYGVLATDTNDPASWIIMDSTTMTVPAPAATGSITAAQATSTSDVTVDMTVDNPQDPGILSP